MSIWRLLRDKLGLHREVSRGNILRAHLNALITDPLAAPAQQTRISLPMADAPGPRCLAVELGLSRLEAYLEDDSRLRIETSGDSMLLQGLPDTVYPSLLKQLNMSFHSRTGTMQGQLSIASKREKREACQTMERVLVELLESQSGGHYSVALERQRRPNNAALIAQIKRLVLNRDMESRRLVYQSIVQGLFYFPVAADTAPHSPPVPKPWKFDEQGKAVWAIFSNSESLPKNSSGAFLLISGIRLVQAAIVHDIGGLQLNPGAEFGGELYRHELDSLGDYLRTLGMMDVAIRRDGTLH